RKGKVMNYLKSIINSLHLQKHVENKPDRVVLYNALSTITNFIFAVFKLIIGLIFFSLWFLIFGSYYMVLFAIRVYFLHKYTKVRKSDLSRSERLVIENNCLREGGALYSLLGMTFTAFSCYMLFYGQEQKYNQSLVLLIALMGFTKIISSVVGWVKSRNFKSPIILFLKSLNIADGLVAIVFTQYSLLSMERSSSATSATGLFGIGIGICLIFVGFFIIFKSLKYKQI
ncbi:hypothetical protein, partial [Oenococcus oeni]